MFSDTDYIDRTKELIAKERSRVTGILSEMGTVRVYRPSANFVLSRILKDDLNADILFDACIREGMMIRNCCTFPFLDNKYFRICFMSPEMNDKLLAVIQKTLG